MACGHRVYRGDRITISVPFDVEDFTNLTITYSTIGDNRIVLTEEDVEIEDGFITATFEGHDLDLLPDGVIYYSISYEEDGVDHTESTNTPLYLKTPAGYEGITPEDIWQSGYTAGQANCSGGTPCDCSSAYTEGYHDGYNQAQEECSGGSCDLQTKYIQLTAHTQTFTAPKGNRPTPPSGASVVYGGDYEQFINLVSGNTDSELAIRGYNDQHTISFIIARFYFDNGALAFRKQIFDGVTYMDDVYDEWTLINVPSWGSIWLYNDRSNLYLCLSITNDWFFDGFEKEDLILPTKPIDGYDVIHISSDLSGSSCNLQAGELNIDTGWTGSEIVTPSQGYDGFNSFEVSDNGYGQGKYQEGYQAALNECSGSSCNLQTKIYIPKDRNMENIFPDAGYDGMSQVMLVNSSLWNSAYTEGFADGQASCPECSGSTDCSSAVTEAFEQGFDSGYTAAQSEYSGGTCNLEQGILYITEDGPWELTPNEGYDGYSSVSVSDNGYGIRYYNSGYTEGFHDGQADCSGSSPNLGLGVLDLQSGDTSPWIMYANQDGFDGYNQVQIADVGYGDAKYSQGKELGFQSGFTAGWRSGASQQCNLYSIMYVVGDGPDVRTFYPEPQYGTGFSSLSVNMKDFGNAKYQSGWNAGYQSGITDNCPSVSYNVELDSAWTGSSVITPPDLVNEIVVTDNGYGAALSGRAYQEGYQQGWDDAGICDCTPQVEAARNSGYLEGEQSVIKSFFAENDTDYVIAYYYNPTNAWMYYAITGVYMYNDGESYSDWVYGYCAFSAMSVNGGAWEAPTLEYLLGPGWTQIRFAGGSNLSAAFSMQATSAKTYAHLDGLKAVSLPSSVNALNDSHTFTRNTSLKVLSSSLSYTQGDVFWGTSNLNTIFSHYTGNNTITLSTAAGSNGVFFYPEGYSATIPSAGNISQWTKIELF